MIINKVRLRNIRSYLIEEIEFPEGSTLLAGDIGSGKSSVLLAIEFALFGIRKGELSGDLLLRKGEDEGYVELFLSVEDKEYIIKRNLKRTSAGVSQESGYIIHEGAKREGTAQELKQYVLNILNYPKELLTKTKSLIYRYTVYTPQEEMKLILLGEKDARLDTLRKVFGIDKYKKIGENSKIITTKIREKQKEIAGFISDLNQKIDQKNNYEKELNQIKNNIKIIIPKYEELNLNLKTKTNSIKNYEEKIREENELKKKFELNNLRINTSLEKRKQNSEKLMQLSLQIENLNKDIVVYDLEEIRKTIVFKKQVLETEQKELDMIKNEISRCLLQEEQSNTLKKDIEELDLCPLCKQEVTTDHKDKIKRQEYEKLDKLNLKKQELIGKKSGIENKIDVLNTELEELKEKQNKAELVLYKKKNLDEKIKEKSKIENEIELTKKEIGIFNELNNEINEKLKNFKGLEELYNKEREELEILREKFRKIEIEKVRFETEINSININIQKITKEITEREKQRDKLNYLTNLKLWIEESFLNMMTLMEKQVMMKVHYDFDSLFRDWFNILMNSEDITISLDEEFTPKILQNGHDIDYSFLSGGEKTAAALAYRLALNQVINNLVSELKTKDLIILDEPTDGFSSEQLDRMKLVLDELKIKQILIVSHEAKIESFVDNTIRFKKENHVSKIF
ncbi:MAG: AAA family ATPase [Candidatus Nanoarchaeia archaeon]|nr:AAA family ATPase [Candidatus Nanoarchaeia archaeon]